MKQIKVHTKNKLIQTSFFNVYYLVRFKVYVSGSGEKQTDK